MSINKYLYYKKKYLEYKMKTTNKRKINNENIDIDNSIHDMVEFVTIVENRKKKQKITSEKQIEFKIGEFAANDIHDIAYQTDLGYELGKFPVNRELTYVEYITDKFRNAPILNIGDEIINDKLEFNNDDSKYIIVNNKLIPTKSNVDNELSNRPKRQKSRVDYVKLNNGVYNDVQIEKLFGKLVELWFSKYCNCPGCNKNTLRCYASKNFPVIDMVCVNLDHNIEEHGVIYFQIKTAQEGSNYFNINERIITIGSKNSGELIHMIRPEDKYELKIYLIGYICIEISRIQSNNLYIQVKKIHIIHPILTNTTGLYYKYNGFGYYGKPTITWDSDNMIYTCIDKIQNIEINEFINIETTTVSQNHAEKLEF